MSLKMNREAYEKMIDEDIEALNMRMPDSLEKDHIVCVLKDSINTYYEPQKEKVEIPSLAIIQFTDFKYKN